MELNEHFKNFSDFENKIQNLKIIEFINHFDIQNRDELKALSLWNEFTDITVKKKIYNKVYYFEKKNMKDVEIVNTSSVTNLDSGGKVISVNDTPQIPIHKPKNINFVYTFVVIISLIFLMNESRMFYETHGFSKINSFVLPVLVELSIMLLAIQKEFRSRLLMVLLIIFNVISFSFFTFEQYEQSTSDITAIINRINILKEQKRNLENAIIANSKSLIDTNKLYKKSINTKYITRANSYFLPRIKKLEQQENVLRNNLFDNNQELARLKVNRSKESIIIGYIALIFLKIFLQLVSINFLSKINILELDPRCKKEN